MTLTSNNPFEIDIDIDNDIDIERGSHWCRPCRISFPERPRAVSSGGMGNPSHLEIVATIGPASRNCIGPLHQAGATAFRLNSSHMPAGEMVSVAGTVRETVPECPLIVDLKGAKMRVGEFAELPVRAGESVRFSLRESEGTIPLPHPEIFDAVVPGETIGCDDDRLRFRVAAVDAGLLEAVSLSDGTLRARKGVNVMEHPVVLKDISPADAACIQAMASVGRVAFAFSFMKDGSEAEWVRKRAPGCEVIGKIERSEAAELASQIVSQVDQVWICRGDLGAQMGPAGMARWVSAYDPRSAPCPVLMAGQVLEHLTCHSSATRAEICHLYDLVSRGYAGFVLSDETAIGSDPVHAVHSLRTLLDEFSQP